MSSVFGAFKAQYLSHIAPNFVSETFVSEALMFKSSTLSPAAMFVIITRNRRPFGPFRLLLFIPLFALDSRDAFVVVDDDDETYLFRDDIAIVAQHRPAIVACVILLLLLLLLLSSSSYVGESKEKSSEKCRRLLRVVLACVKRRR